MKKEIGVRVCRGRGTCGTDVIVTDHKVVRGRHRAGVGNDERDAEE